MDLVAELVNDEHSLSTMLAVDWRFDRPARKLGAFIGYVNDNIVTVAPAAYRELIAAAVVDRIRNRLADRKHEIELFLRLDQFYNVGKSLLGRFA